MSKKIILALTLTSLFTLTTISFAQTLTPLVHQSPGGANLAFQLTDGTVMCQANSSQNWYKLTPDDTGSYVNGTWTQVASLQAGYVPDDFASAVLADGRVVITGGEYNNGQFTLTNLGAIYDPIANTWTPLAAPPGWDLNGEFCYFPPGEVGPGILLADGRVFCTGSYSTNGPGHTALYTPSTATWAVGPDFPNGDNAGDSFSVLLPNGNALVEGVTGTLYEFDGTNLNPTLTASGALMVLPTGQVLVSSGTFAQVYTPANIKFQSKW